MTVTALLVSHDGARWLPAVLAGLTGQTLPVDRVVAVDTTSRDDSVQLVDDAFSTAGADRLVLDVVHGSTSYPAAVRHGLGLGFPGGTYEQRFFVADVQATGEAVSDQDVNLCLGPQSFCAVFPVRSTGQHRLIGLVPESVADRDDLTFEDVRAGDLMAIHSAGAYGYVMSSNYNTRGRPAEVLVDGDRFALVTQRESYEHLVTTELLEPEWRVD